MSILIKGMEMPDKCGHCRFTSAFDCGVTGNFISTHSIRQPDCPLIPIPPHGRLIDADAYRAEMKKRQDACAEWRDEIKSGGGYGTELFYRTEGFLGAMIEAKLTLDKMPAIIPADKEGE